MYGPFGNLFPYSDQHAMNLDWIIQVAKDFLDQYTHIQDIISNGEESLDQHTTDGVAALDQHTTDGLAALAAEKDRLEGLLDAWYTTHSEDIADQLTAAVASFLAQASAIGEAVIDSIPDDYSALSAAVVKNTQTNQYQENGLFSKLLNTQENTIFSSYTGDTSHDSVTTSTPFILYTSFDWSNYLITKIKINIASAGTLSVGYIAGRPENEGTLDTDDVTIIEQLTFAETGVQEVILPTPFVVPKNCCFLIGYEGDTAQFKSGGTGGTNSGFLYTSQHTTFTRSTAYLGINVIGYNYYNYFTTLQWQQYLDLLSKQLGVTSFNPIDGYDADNSQNTTSNYFVMNRINPSYAYMVNQFKININTTGILSIGTVKRNKAVAGESFSASDITTFKNIKITETGEQTISLPIGMVVNSDEYMVFGNKFDTAKWKWGDKGTDKGFVYPSSGTWTANPKSLGIKVFASTYDLMSRNSTYKGKKLSILGDSISTYEGYIPEGNVSYYPHGSVTSVTDTWWHKLISATGMTLLVNNSWSGSRVTTRETPTNSGVERCEDLGTDPDVIIVWMGINDFNGEVSLGTYDGKSAIPVTTTTFREAYGIMLNKILTKYTQSEVWVCTLPQCERNSPSDAFPEINNNGVALADFNKAIVELANAFGVKILDHNKCGLTYQNMSVYNPDELHPNPAGHSLVANNDIWQMDNFIRFRY